MKNLSLGELVSKIDAFAHKKEGFTVQITHTEHGFGFAAISPEFRGYIVAFEETQDSFDSCVTAINIAIEKGTNLVGGWYNMENGFHYFDAVKSFDNFTEAEAFGIKNRQLSIFHYGTQTCLYLDEKSQTYK